MKKIYLVLVLSCFVLSGWAQTLNESFNSAVFPPIGWQNNQVSGTGKWARVTTGTYPGCSPHSGAGMAKYKCFDFSTGTNAILVSPPLVFNGTTAHIFSFWKYADSAWPIYADSIGVYYNSMDTLAGATRLATIPRYNPVDGWYKHSFLLPGSLTGIQYMILRGYSHNGENMYVDDVKLIAQPADDLSALSVNTETYLSETAPTIPSVKIKNTGANIQNGFEVVCKIYNSSDNEIYSDTQTVSALNSWNTVDVDFASFTLPAPESIYKFKIFTSMGSDMDHSNDTIIKTVYTYVHNKQNVLLEMGTGTWCPYCPGAAMGADQLVENGNHVAVVENHDGDPYTYAGSSARNDYYGLEYFPTAIFDGIRMLVGGDHTISAYPSYLPVYQTRYAMKTAFGITIGDGAKVGQVYNLSVTVHRYGETPFANSNLVLHLALTQSHIMVNWQGQTHLEYVSRAMAPGATGTPINLQNDTTVTVPLSFTFNPSWGGNLVNDYELVAWMQDLTTKEVVDAQKVNLQSILVGVDEHNSEPGAMKIYPNPVKNAATIEIPQPCEGTLSVLDLNGRELLKKQTASGIVQFDFSGFANGVYTIRLLSNDRTEVRKIVKE